MSWTTLTIKDAAGTNRTVRVWDESGAGTGPYQFHLPYDDSNTTGIYGEVQATPTANTILGRLKDIDDQVTANAIAAGTVASRSTDILSVMPAEVHTKAAISAASSGDNTLLAAQGAGNSICVTSLFLVAASAVTVRFESGAGGTALTGVMSLAANSGFVLPYNPDGWFETGDNALLNLELGGAVQVSGAFSYVVR